MMNQLNLGFRRRIPVILQTEASECGLACVCMIANYFGYKTDLNELRKEHRVSLKGATLEDIASICESLGLVARGLRLEPNELAQLAKPAILHWNLNHFVVLTATRAGKVWVIDPAHGELELDVAEVSAQFTGVALELAPGFEFQRKTPPPPLKLSHLVGRVTGLRASLFQIFMLALVLEGLAVTLPLITQWITDEVIVAGSHDLLTTLGLAAMAVGVVMAAISALRGWVALYIGSHFNLQWMANVMAHLLKLPIDYFERRHIGDVVSRFGSVGTIAHTLTGTTVEIALDGLLAIGMLGMMLLYSTLLSLVVIGIVVIYAALRWVRFKAVRAASSGALAKHAKEQTYFLETIRGVRSVKLFNKEPQRRAAWLTLWVDATNASLQIDRFNLFFTGAWGILSSIERAGVLWLGALAVIDHRLSLGMLMAFLAYKEQFSGRVNSLVDRIVEVKMLSVATERLADIVLGEPEEKPGHQSKEPLGESTLALDHVSFKYAAGERAVLSNVNLIVRPGECIAIIGPSGCGKTTCMKLLLGILAPTQGQVRFSDRPLKQLGLRRYREFVAAVMQDDHLFAGSIFDNICFHDAKPDAEWMHECSRNAGMHAEIIAMPMGYYTLVGDMGTVLSGGQKQRLLLARALYRRPKILFLDEATSHLDLENERKISDSLSRLQMTRIMIAHRPQTIAIADRVYRMHECRLIEEKSYSARREVEPVPWLVAGGA
jgi:ATP-binding cassette subfamily B protein RaxB